MHDDDEGDEDEEDGGEEDDDHDDDGDHDDGDASTIAPTYIHPASVGATHDNTRFVACMCANHQRLPLLRCDSTARTIGHGTARHLLTHSLTRWLTCTPS